MRHHAQEIRHKQRAPLRHHIAVLANLFVFDAGRGEVAVVLRHPNARQRQLGRLGVLAPKLVDQAGHAAQGFAAGGSAPVKLLIAAQRHRVALCVGGAGDQRHIPVHRQEAQVLRALNAVEHLLAPAQVLAHHGRHFAVGPPRPAGVGVQRKRQAHLDAGVHRLDGRQHRVDAPGKVLGLEKERVIALHHIRLIAQFPVDGFGQRLAAQARDMRLLIDEAHPFGRLLGQLGITALVHVQLDQGLRADMLAGFQELQGAVENLLKRLARVGEYRLALGGRANALFPVVGVGHAGVAQHGGRQLFGAVRRPIAPLAVMVHQALAAVDPRRIAAHE